MGDLARESILQALVAAFVVAALARAWRVEDPGVRLRLGLLALACPALLTPSLRVFAPGRTTDAFREGRALFDSLQWNDVGVAGIGLADTATWLLAAAGLVLLLRDLIPWLHDHLQEDVARTAGATVCPEARAAFGRVTGAMRVNARPLVVLDDEAVVLQCTGARRTTVVISRGACDRLDAAELDAALAHEAAHLERRDTALGWGLMLVRVLLWFNPVAQVLARAATQHMEVRADDRAAGVTGDRVALASALIKIFRATDGAHHAPRWPVPGLDTSSRTMSRLRAAALEARCRRLLDPPAPPPPSRRLVQAQLLLAAFGVGTLLFFVV